MLDWDTEGAPEDGPGIVSVEDNRGRSETARSVKLPTVTLRRLPPETKAAASAAM